MKPDYKNWVPRGLLFLLGGMAIICLALCIVFGMAGVCEKLKECGYEKVELVDTTDGLFLTKKESGVYMLAHSKLLVGKK